MVLERNAVIVGVVPLLGSKAVVAVPDLHLDTVHGACVFVHQLASDVSGKSEYALEPASRQKLVPLALTEVLPRSMTQFCAGVPLQS